MFAAPPSPALTGPGSLAPAVRVLPFRHRLPPIVAVESRSVNDGAGDLMRALETALPLPLGGLRKPECIADRRPKNRFRENSCSMRRSERWLSDDVALDGNPLPCS